MDFNVNEVTKPALVKETAMEEFFGTTASMVVGSITWIAYTRPAVYRRLHPWLLVFTQLVFVAALFHDVGVSRAEDTIISMRTVEIPSQVVSAMDSLRPVSAALIFVIDAAVVAWICVLYSLPYWLTTDQRPR